MSPRDTETALARFTLAALVLYFPAETWASLPHGLWNPFYLVDLIAMLLMLWGSIHSLRARPRPGPALLCAAYAWAGANGWRATFWRVFDVLEGRELEYGLGEVWGVGTATAIGLACFALSLVLVVKKEQRRDVSDSRP